MQMHTVQRLDSSHQRRDTWMNGTGFTVLPATHTFIHEWNEQFCMNFVSIHQMASAEQGGWRTSGSAYYSSVDPESMKG